MAYVVEDTRLSTLLRKLVKEGDESVALALASHVNECLLYPENGSYISRSSDVLQDAVLEVVHSKDHSQAVKVLCGVALGRVGALHSNYSQWVGWVWGQVEKAGDREKLQLVYLGALEESLVRGGGSKEGVARLLDTAKTRLEQTQSEVLMLALLGVVEAAAKHWGILFKGIFTEVVDITVGWFMESSSMPDIRVKIARALMSWGVFWQGEPEFAADQLGFYMEDLVLEVAGEDGLDMEELEEGEAGSLAVRAVTFKWQDEKVEEEERGKAHRQLLAFLQMAECVLVGVGGGANLALARLDGLSLPKLGLWLELVSCTTTAGLSWRWTEDLAMSSLRCLMACLRVMEGLAMAGHQDREALVVAAALQLVGRSSRLCTEGLRSLCGHLSSLTSAQPAQLQLVAEAVLGQGGLLPRAALEAPSPALQAASVALVQALLQSKSVTVLTEVWRLLAMRAQQATAALSLARPEDPPWGQEQLSISLARRQLAWVLACLGKMATTTGSVLSMWALDPSIFLLLSLHCGLTSSCLAREHPSLHWALASLLTQHSATHSHFLSSSSLLSSSSSPTAGHFSSLLSLLTHLQSWTEASPQV